MNKDLTFKEAYFEMLKGKKAKRPMMSGYWYINHLTGKLVIHLANGDEISEDVDMQSTIMNVMAEDWEIIENKRIDDWQVCDAKKGGKRNG